MRSALRHYFCYDPNSVFVCSTIIPGTSWQLKPLYTITHGWKSLVCIHVMHVVQYVYVCILFFVSVKTTHAGGIATRAALKVNGVSVSVSVEDISANRPLRS